MYTFRNNVTEIENERDVVACELPLFPMMYDRTYFTVLNN